MAIQDEFLVCELNYAHSGRKYSGGCVRVRFLVQKVMVVQSVGVGFPITFDNDRMWDWDGRQRLGVCVI